MLTTLLTLLHTRLDDASARRRLAEEDGFSTAELLANAALAVGALVAIWGAMNTMGVDVVEWIGTQLTGA